MPGSMPDLDQIAPHASVKRWVIAASALLVLTILFAYAYTAPKPAGFGEGLPVKPCSAGLQNCVSSLNTEPELAAEAFTMQGSLPAMQADLAAAIRAETNVQVAFESRGRIDVTFRTAIFRFPDDAQFLLDRSGNVHFHSKSRIGHSDFGVNRARIERIRQRLQQTELDAANF